MTVKIGKFKRQAAGILAVLMVLTGPATCLASTGGMYRAADNAAFDYGVTVDQGEALIPEETAEAPDQETPATASEDTGSGTEKEEICADEVIEDGVIADDTAEDPDIGEDAEIADDPEADIASESETDTDTDSILLDFLDRENGYIDPDFVPGKVGTGMFRSASALPSRYVDMRDKMPPVRDQGRYGTCWAHAAIGVAEAGMINSGRADASIDYSERALAYFSYKHQNDPLNLTGGDYASLLYSDEAADIYNRGGNSIWAAFSLSGWQGVTDESLAEYDPKNMDAPDHSVAYEDEIVLTGARFYNPDQRQVVKQAIMDNGAVSVALHMYTSSEEARKYMNHIDDEWYYYVDEESYANHSVLFVGWDDSISKSNFASCPSINGAWLCRNSYGESFGDDGYFWVSYDDAGISDFASMEFVDADDAWDNNYFYDGSIANCRTSVAANRPFGNIYRTQGAEEEIAAVNFAVYNTDRSGTVEIYTNSSEMNTPMDGKKVAEKGFRTTATGIYTITLDEPITVSEGEYFSAVITFDSDTFIFTDYSYIGSGINFVSSTAPKQSMRVLGNVWRDWNDNSTCARIKVFTNNVGTDVGKVILKGNGGLTSAGSESETVRVPVGSSYKLSDGIFTREGYDFCGWKETFRNGSEAIFRNSGEEICVTGVHTFEAQWKANNVCRIQYHLGREFDESYEDASVNKNSNYTFTLPNGSFYKTSYMSFLYWADENGRKYEAGKTYLLPNKDRLDLYAVWDSWLIEYLNISRFEEKDQFTQAEWQSIKKGQSGTVRSNTFPRAEAEFKGWQEKSGDEYIQRNPGQKITPTANCIMYARWQSEYICNIEYYQDKNSSKYYEDEGYRNGSYTFRAPSAGFEPYSGAKFECWEDVSGKQYFPGNTVVLPDKKELVLFAVWKDKAGNKAKFISGSEFNAIAANMVKGSSVSFRRFTYSRTAPDTRRFTAVNVSETGVSIMLWYDKYAGTLYWYSKDSKPYLNEDSSYMFSNFADLTDISGLTDVDAFKVEDASSMFSGCRSITGLSAINNWDVSSVIRFRDMFKGCSRLYSFSTSTIKDWDIRKGNDFSGMFAGINGRPSFSFSKRSGSWAADGSFIPSSVYRAVLKTGSEVNTIFGELVQSELGAGYGVESIREITTADSLKNLGSSCRKISDAGDVFAGIDGDTIRIFCYGEIDMNADSSGMFMGMSGLVSAPGIASWNTDDVTDMSDMFNGCSSYPVTDLGSWNTGNAAYMDRMFRNCTGIINGDFSNFNTGKVVSAAGFLDGAVYMQDVLLGSKWNGKVLLPKPSGQYIKDADGKWYDVEGRGYKPESIPKNTAARYYAYPGYHKPGWYQDAEGYRRYNDQNGPVKDAWVKSGDKWYYLDPDGRMAKDCLIEYSGSLYGVDKSGARLVRAWKKVRDTADDCDYWYYFDAEGKAVHSVLQYTIDSKVYGFDDECRRLSGFTDADGNRLEGSDAVLYAVYYYGKDDQGYLQYGWYSHTDMLSRGIQDEYKDYSELRFYFDKDSKGKKLVSQTRSINNDTYSFDAKGVSKLIGYFKVSFDSCGGSAVADQTVKKGSRATSKTPARTGYKFEGWYLGSTKYNFYSAVTKDIVLVARWTPNKYSVKFERNGATSGYTNNLNNLEYGHEGGYALPANGYKRDGYSFSGWNTRSDGKGVLYESGSRINNLTANNGTTVVLYACWTPAAYRIRYWSGNKEITDELTGAPKTYTYSSSCKLPSSIPASCMQPNVRFDGWYETSALTKKVTSIAAKQSGDKNFYAGFVNNKSYKIEFVKNAADASGSIKAINVTAGKNPTLPTNTFRRNKYTFAGWSTNPSEKPENVMYRDRAVIVSPPEMNSRNVVTLYAIWKKR